MRIQENVRANKQAHERARARQASKRMAYLHSRQQARARHAPGMRAPGSEQAQAASARASKHAKRRQASMRQAASTWHARQAASASAPGKRARLGSMHARASMRTKFFENFS